MVLVGDVDTKTFDVFKQSLGDLKRSSLFYLTYTDPGKGHCSNHFITFQIIKNKEVLLSKFLIFYFDIINYFWQDSHGIKWQQIISLNHFENVVSNPIKMDPANGIIIEEYDFQGMMVFGQATNWAPFRVSYCLNFII